jgi:hypothetical protein
MSGSLRLGTYLASGPVLQSPALTLSAYIERVVKLVPAEFVALYLAVEVILGNSLIASTVWAITCLVLVVVVRAAATSDPAAQLGPQWIAVAIAAVAFVIWVYAMRGPFAANLGVVPGLGSLALVLWTFLVPVLYRG